MNKQGYIRMFNITQEKLLLYLSVFIIIYSSFYGKNKAPTVNNKNNSYLGICADKFFLQSNQHNYNVGNLNIASFRK